MSARRIWRPSSGRSASAGRAWKRIYGRFSRALKTAALQRICRIEVRMSERVRNNAQYAIPDDPELSTYRFIIVAAKRARQPQNGARSFLPTTSKKPTVASMEEVRRGLVKYFDPMRIVPEEEPSAE